MLLNKTESHFPQNKSIDFLIVSYGGGHIQAILPVAKRLIKKGFNVYIFALTTAIDVVKKSKVPFFSYKDLPEAYDFKAIKLGMELAKEMGTNNIIDYEETVAYLGLNFIDLERRYDKEKAKKIWIEKGRQAFDPSYLMESLIKNINPKVVISTNSPRTEKASILAAKNLGIKAACISDGLAIIESEWMKDNNFANIVFVLNDSVQQLLVNKGRAYKDICVSGNPAFDSLFDPIILDKAKEMKKQKGWNDGNVNILFASSPEIKKHPITGEDGDIDLPNKIEKCLKKYVRKNKNTNLIIRKHPSEHQDISLEERVYQSSKDDDISVIVNLVDLVIHTASTVGIQALISRKPVINIDISVFSKDLPLTHMGMGTGVDDLNDLEKVIKKSLKMDDGRSDDLYRPKPATDIISNKLVTILNDI